MKFSCEKALLVAGVSVASRTVSTKNAIPALEGILVKTSVYLELTGYNLETGITVKVPAAIEEPGEAIIPARLFSDIIRKLPDDTVYISIDNSYKVSIQCGVSSFTIMASSAEDYPSLPDVESQKGIAIPQKELREMIGGTIFSVSENQARPVHTGCLFEVEADTITVVAVDGYRFAMRRYHAEESADRKLKFVAPAAALREVEKILADTDENAYFTVGTKHLMFQIGEATLICRLLEGDFLDWRRVVPTNNPIILTANVAEITSSIERVSLVISEKLKSPVRCLFGENTAEFRTISTIGTAHDGCNVSGDGTELEIGFNCRYLLEALKAVTTPEVNLGLSNSLSPVVMTPPDGTDKYSYMVLPVRLKSGE